MLCGCITTMKMIQHSLDAVIIHGLYNITKTPLYLGEVTCQGNEHYLNDCRHETPLNDGCTHAVISCGKQTSKGLK